MVSVCRRHHLDRYGAQSARSREFKLNDGSRGMHAAAARTSGNIPKTTNIPSFYARHTGRSPKRALTRVRALKLPSAERRDTKHLSLRAFGEVTQIGSCRVGIGADDCALQHDDLVARHRRFGER